ncbi:hypothetical protein A1353_11860 [Methylomonas methanica]|uniref:Uncharacterized protein n=1 Tax=Methylomonas methanica TaxID=421 RepID=A0A177MIS9_METMH|nr:hypothetical protein [Methylomonas methanica]OAI05265.1 hypothetical protein A1353_11860 [Methylomonas methanica]
MRYRLAWPILACIGEATESDELKRLAKAAQDGELGDREDWIIAQERWQNQGLTISDFHYVPQCELPFDNQIAKLGFPFVLSAATLTHSGTELPIAIQLFEMWQSLPPSLAKKRVTHNVLFAMSCAGDKGVIWDTLKIDDFKELLANRSKDHFYLSSLAAVPTSFWEHSEFVSILGNVGCDSLIIYGRPKRDFVSNLENLVVEYPNNSGLLRLLAIACLTGHRPGSTIKTNLGSFSGHKERLAALTIKIAQADWYENEASQLAEAIMQLDKLSSAGVDSSLKIIKLQKLSGRNIELFLNRLYAILPSNKWEQRQEVFHAMLDQQRHRRADTTKLAV